MKKNIRKIFILSAGMAMLSMLFLLPAHAGENQFFGTLTGATFGGIIGNQFGHGDGRIATTAGGAVAGAWVGNDIGYTMDNSERNVVPSRGYSTYSSSSSGSFSYQTTYVPNYVAPND